MKRCQGITEAFWSAMSEDHRLAWKYASRIIGLIAALLVAKTGNVYVDGILTAVTAIFLMIAIETQRSYSKLGPRLRKASIRVLIFLGSWGIAFVGIAYFSQAAVIASARIVVDEMFSVLGQDQPALLSYICFALFVIAVPVAVNRVLRQLSIEQLIYHVPRQALKNLFIRRPQKAASFPMFACIELALLIVCLMYVSVVAALVKSFLSIVGASYAG